MLMISWLAGAAGAAGAEAAARAAVELSYGTDAVHVRYRLFESSAAVSVQCWLIARAAASAGRHQAAAESDLTQLLF